MTAQVSARVAKWAFLGGLLVVSLVPLLWLVVSAFKTTPELFRGPFTVPGNWSLVNFRDALKQAPLVSYFRNSVIIAAVATLATVTIATMAAYALRHRFRLNGLTSGFLMAGLLVPVTPFMTPIFYIIERLGLYNTVWGVALVYSGMMLPVGFLIVRTYIETVPEETLEAARIDGASFHGVFFRVIVPLTAPGLATAAIFVVISDWNELLFANLLTTGPAAQTLQVGVTTFLTGYASNYPEAFAATAMAMAPTVLAYALLSNRVIDSMAASAFK